MDESQLVQAYRSFGDLFLKTAQITGFEYQGRILQISLPERILGIQWERKAGQVVPATIRVSLGSMTEMDKFMVSYIRRVARSTGELVEMANLVNAVHEAARHNGWSYQLEDTTLYLSSKDGLTEADHEPAAKRLAVLDSFISMYLREL